jgi:hypothetical protein
MMMYNVEEKVYSTNHNYNIALSHARKHPYFLLPPPTPIVEISAI